MPLRPSQESLVSRPGVDATVQEDHRAAVFATSVATLYQHGPKILAANVINAVVVAAVLWGRVEHRSLLGWVAAMSVMVAIRLWINRGFVEGGPPSRNALWARRFTIGSALSGVLWGAGAVMLFAPGNLTAQVLLAFTIGGMGAGAASSVASHLPAFYAFIVPATLPLIARFSLGSDPLHWGMAAMLGLFVVLVTMIGRTTHRTITESYRLGFVNEALVGRLCDAHRDLESSNTELEARVHERTKELERQTAARRSAERQLARGQKLEAVGRLTGGVAHDFNNLLSVVVGALEELDTDVDPSRRGELLAHARQAALRGGSLTRSLLAFSRREPVVAEVLDPCEVLREMTGSMIRRALPETIDLHVALAEGPLRVEADRAQLETAVLNLVINARDAMPDGGPLLVEVREVELEDGVDPLGAGSFVEVWVADSGEGIAPQLLSRVFEPYFTTKGESGTGLGLSMVYGFAEQSNGGVRIESTEGSGTSVRLLLPRLAATTPVAVEPSAPAVPRGSGQTVLVVEDEESVRHLTAMSVRGLGYLPLEAGTAQDALDRLREHSEISLVITDIVMPGGKDGVWLTKEIQQRYPGLPVVMASGYSSEQTDTQGVPRLAKPYRRAALAQCLDDALATG